MRLPKLNTSTDGLLFAFSTGLAVLFALLGIQRMSPEFFVIFIALVIVMISSWKNMKRGRDN